MSVLLLIIGLLLFIGLVVLHEFGHFIMARRNGVEVEEFGIGFPPRIWSKKTKSGFDFSINWLPIGGFVKLKGESDSATASGTFGAASTIVKTKIMLAGVFMNLLIAFVLFMGLAWVGIPQLISNQYTVKSNTKVVSNEVLVGYVESNSPASKAGLQSHYRLLSIGTVGGQTNYIKSSDQLPALTKKYAGQKVVIHYEEGNNLEKTTVTLRTEKAVEASVKRGDPEGNLGISPTEINLDRSTWSAPIVAAGLIKQFTVITFQGLGTVFSALLKGQGHRAASQVSGPVGIVVLLKASSTLGYQFVLMLIAIISLTLAIMNVLPIPALDGGRLFMILLTHLFGKQMSQDMEERLVGASFVLLMFIIALVTVVDVKRFF
jgi:regulator of sigma E protease